MAHRARTVATCAVVSVGVAALVLTAGAGAAARRDLSERIGKMGSNTLAVRAGHFQRFGRHVQLVSRSTTLTLRDVTALRRHTTGVRRISGLAVASLPVRWRGELLSRPTAGVEPEYSELQRLPARNGRWFTRDEERGRARVAVLGAVVARGLFGLEDPVRERIRVGGSSFEVVGVLAEMGYVLPGIDPDNSVFVPLTTFLSRVAARTYLDAILIQATTPVELPNLRQQVAALLRAGHRIPAGIGDDFTVQDPVMLLTAEHDMGEAYRALVGGVSAVSLATGGIGIVAVMLMAVRERTGEIGLRRAIGATRRAILLQFLVEAGLLSTIGGLAGIFIALPVHAVVCVVAGWPLVWPVAPSLWAAAMAAGLGVVCGVFPAARAARLQPATAVRVRS